MILRSGKYEGKTVQWVKDNNPKYIEWVKENQPKMLKEPVKSITPNIKVVGYHSMKNFHPNHRKIYQYLLC